MFIEIEMLIYTKRKINTTTVPSSSIYCYPWQLTTSREINIDFHLKQKGIEPEPICELT